MDTSTLTSPGTGGRSRFSKALPAPPSESKEASPAVAAAAAGTKAWKIPRKPPALPKLSPTAFPPRKESIGARFIPKPLDSPLPAVPAETATPKKMNSIPRKAVGQPLAPQPQQQQEQQPQANNERPLSPAKLKRVSSISSILSAYSGTSDGSGHRGSQGSVTTKNSEPSHSPGRDAVVDQRDKFFESLGDFSGNPHTQEPTQTQTRTSHDAVPPPPKDVSSGATGPRVGGLPANPRSRLPKSPRPEVPAATSSPTSSPRDSSPKPEIWKRRASKSDASRGVPELSLPTSHGSTAETTPSRSAALPVAPRDDPKTTPSLSVGQTPHAGISGIASPAASKLAGLPGRDIRPSQAAELKGDEDMKKIKHAAKTMASRATGRTFADDDDVSINSAEANEIERSFNVLPRTRPPTPPQEESGPRPVPGDREGWSKQQYVPTAPAPFVRRPGSSGLEERGDPALVRQLRTGSADHESPPVSSGHQSRPGSSGHQSRSGPGLRNKNSFVQESKPDTTRGGAEPSRSPQPWTLTSPATLIPPSKHDVFELVTDLNADTTKASPRSRPPVAHSNATVDNRLSMVGEVSNEAKALGVAATDKLSAADKAKVEEAVDMFPRQAPMAPSSNGVFAAAPLAVHHFQCLSKHKQWVRAKNVHYSLACATCHAEDREWRAVCKTCSLRVCYQCAGKLTEHGDLSHMLQELQRQQETQTAPASQQPTVVVDTDPAKPE